MSDSSWLSTRRSLLVRVRDPTNEAAWSDFTEKYRPLIVDYCVRRFRVRMDTAEDVAQTVLLKVLVEMRRFEYDPAKSFRGWLKIVTKNTLVTHFRSDKRRIDKGTGDSNIQELVENLASPDASDALSSSLSIQIQQDLFREAEPLVRGRVDDKTWNAYRARCDGKKAKDIGKELGMRVAAVHKAKSRVIQMLREEVAMAVHHRKE